MKEISEWIRAEIEKDSDGFSHWVFRCKNCGAPCEKLEDKCPQCKCKMSNVHEVWEELYTDFLNSLFGKE